MVIIPKRFLFTKQKEPNASFKIERIIKRKYKCGKKYKKTNVCVSVVSLGPPVEDKRCKPGPYFLH